MSNFHNFCNLHNFYGIVMLVRSYQQILYSKKTTTCELENTKSNSDSVKTKAEIGKKES